MAFSQCRIFWHSVSLSYCNPNEKLLLNVLNRFWCSIIIKMGQKGKKQFFSSLRKAKFLFKVSMMFSHFKNTLLSQINRFTIGNWYRKSRRSKSRLRSQVLYAAENSSSLTFLLQHWVF